VCGENGDFLVNFDGLGDCFASAVAAVKDDIGTLTLLVKDVSLFDHWQVGLTVLDVTDPANAALAARGFSVIATDEAVVAT